MICRALFLIPVAMTTVQRAASLLVAVAKKGVGGARREEAGSIGGLESKSEKNQTEGKSPARHVRSYLLRPLFPEFIIREWSTHPNFRLPPRHIYTATSLVNSFFENQFHLFINRPNQELMKLTAESIGCRCVFYLFIYFFSLFLLFIWINQF